MRKGKGSPFLPEPVLMPRIRTILLYLAASILCAAVSLAQPDQGLPATDPLYKTVSGLDTALFDAVNHCELDKLSSMVTGDLEFYHDLTGLAVGRQVFLDAVKNNLCGKVHRELVSGTLEVYPLKGYGAVEIGVHRFTHPGDPTNIGEAKFIHVWQLKDGVWQIARVISFDHHSGAK